MERVINYNELRKVFYESDDWATFLDCLRDLSVINTGAIDELRRRLSQQTESKYPEWVAVDDIIVRPPDGENVIVAIRDDSGDSVNCYTTVGWYIALHRIWIVDNEINNKVTHWKPMPHYPSCK